MHYQVGYQMVQTYIDIQTRISSEELDISCKQLITVVKVCYYVIHARISVFSDPYIPVFWHVLHSMCMSNFLNSPAKSHCKS